MKVILPSALKQYADNQASVDLPGATVAEVLDELVGRYPHLRKHLFSDDGRIRAFVNVYVNEDDIRHLERREGTALTSHDVISIIPSIAGGSLPRLSPDEMQRYARHLILPEVGMEGQQRLKAAKVLCVGAGGLGSPLAMYLAAAGVGTLGLVDFDVVDASNLHRQIIHFTSDVGKPKLESAEQKLRAINPEIEIRKFETRLTSANALEIIRDFDIVADGTDNFPTRYLINDACVLSGKPNVYGSIFRFEGQASIFATSNGPCYRCLYPEPPPPGLVPSCAEGGVLGVLPGLVGVVQATEVIKLILRSGEPLIGRLLLLDAWTMRFREMRLKKDPACPVCGPNPTVTELIDYNAFCGINDDKGVAPMAFMPEMSVEELKQKMDAKEDIFVLDVREPHEYQICNINAHLIPLGQLQARVGELDPDKHIVVHCRSGKRSADAVNWLQSQGFEKVQNLAGGILAWADKIDPKMAKY
jgi:sulfur-carrier protein adenylyltransferase/sulfurtransferase